MELFLLVAMDLSKSRSASKQLCPHPGLTLEQIHYNGFGCSSRFCLEKILLVKVVIFCEFCITEQTSFMLSMIFKGREEKKLDWITERQKYWEGLSTTRKATHFLHLNSQAEVFSCEETAQVWAPAMHSPLRKAKSSCSKRKALGLSHVPSIWGWWWRSQKDHYSVRAQKHSKKQKVSSGANYEHYAGMDILLIEKWGLCS